MIIKCPQCQSRFRFDENKLGQRPRARTRCSKCGGAIEIENPALASMTLPPDYPVPTAPPPAPTPAPAPRPAMTGDTQTRRTPLHALQQARPQAEIGSSTLTGGDLHERGLIELPKDKRFSLAVIQGAATGQIFQISKSRTTMGRSEADIVLDDPEASRQHAVVEFVGEHAILRDLGSTNGTFVDSERIEHKVMTNQMEFRIGSHSLMFIITKLE